ncbi:hypothetical protein GUJ93_ZPchr0015g6990 [Zizania palustris]|uniref:Uncharacterized protein n=1 Tax=Zizania palustris TaxID=103762 RepID=A0A8J5SYJ5_ZIZPA|nr:hypothetical protein GUJ93_ZPchr0015g6990 [Zizania palustris]
MAERVRVLDGDDDPVVSTVHRVDAEDGWATTDPTVAVARAKGAGVDGDGSPEEEQNRSSKGGRRRSTFALGGLCWRGLSAEVGGGLNRGSPASIRQGTEGFP